MIEQLIEAVKEVRRRAPERAKIIPSVGFATHIDHDGVIHSGCEVWSGYHYYYGDTIESALAAVPIHDPIAEKREELATLKAKVEQLEKEIAQ